MMQDKSEARLISLQLLQFLQAGRDILRAFLIVVPVGQKTVAEIFVDLTVMPFDDLLCRPRPRFRPAWPACRSPCSGSME